MKLGRIKDRFYRVCIADDKISIGITSENMATFAITSKKYAVSFAARVTSKGSGSFPPPGVVVCIVRLPPIAFPYVSSIS